MLCRWGGSSAGTGHLVWRVAWNGVVRLGIWWRAGEARALEAWCAAWHHAADSRRLCVFVAVRYGVLRTSGGGETIARSGEVDLYEGCSVRKRNGASGVPIFIVAASVVRVECRISEQRGELNFCEGVRLSEHALRLIVLNLAYSRRRCLRIRRRGRARGILSHGNGWGRLLRARGSICVGRLPTLR